MLDLGLDAVAASWTVADDRRLRWQAECNDLFAVVAGRFAQADSRYLIYSIYARVLITKPPVSCGLDCRWVEQCDVVGMCILVHQSTLALW